MSKKLDFENKFKQLVNIVHESTRGRTLDVRLMIELGFSPTSWKVWKPKFIEQGRIKHIPIWDEKCENIISHCLIEYNGKKKWWELKEYDENQIGTKLNESYS